MTDTSAPVADIRCLQGRPLQTLRMPFNGRVVDAVEIRETDNTDARFTIVALSPTTPARFYMGAVATLAMAENAAIALSDELADLGGPPDPAMHD